MAFAQQIALWTGVAAGSQALVDAAKDAFGFANLAKKRDAQTLALTSPNAYLQRRNTEIAHLEHQIAVQWAQNVANFVTTGVGTVMQGTNILIPRIPAMPESVAKERATKLALANWESGIKVIDMDYPLDAMSIAVHRQSNQNARNYAEGAEISGVAPRRKAAPKKRGRPKKK